MLIFVEGGKPENPEKNSKNDVGQNGVIISNLRILSTI
jgi:hypothetical protein